MLILWQSLAQLMSLWVLLIGKFLMKPSDWLILKRKVRFGDCDSAGVIHFHNLLRWSHETWEESIEIYGIPYQNIFPDLSLHKNKIILPIVNCEANFCGG